MNCGEGRDPSFRRKSAVKSAVTDDSLLIVRQAPERRKPL
jgi:hypothetical protein